MSLQREHFAKFFAAVNDGRTPFRWQERLLDTVLETGRWPDRIAAPTGAGKTSAIDVHVFATALTASSGGQRLPRRLAMVVDRRVLVDDQYERAVALAAKLAQPEDDLVTEIAEVLTALSTLDGSVKLDAPALVTARLRGASVPSRSWRDYPTACAVLCATPDMWGSRLLLGGYGASEEAMPREAGLLAFDSVVLVDEAHLARQLLVTARRVPQFAEIAEQPLTGVPLLQVVEVSATPDHDGTADIVTAAVDEDDLTEEHLAARLTRPKPVTLLPVAGWPPTRQIGKVAATVARAVIDMCNEIEHHEDCAATIGCYVNTVPMAIAVADALRSESLRVVTVCGQVRPADLSRLNNEYEGLLSTRGSADVDVLVSTQSLEVGADLDLAGIVTELATGPALAQRAGRVNRLGRRHRGPVTVIVPADPVSERMRSGPYPATELGDALAWVTGLGAGPQGFAPWAVRQSPPPSAQPRRMLYQRPELGDAWHWARTSDNLAAGPELELWVSDSLEAETSVGIAVRDAMPDDPAEAIELIRDLPPQRWEVFAVPYRTAASVLRELLEADQTLVKVRGGEIALARLRPSGQADVRPGDLVVADSSAQIVTQAAGNGFSPPVVASLSAAGDSDAVEGTRRGRADDVLHYPPDLPHGSVVLRLEWSNHHEQVAGFARETASSLLAGFTENFEESTERTRRDLLAARLKAMPHTGVHGGLATVINAAIGLLRGRVSDSDVILRRADDDSWTRVVVIDRRRAVADEDLRQVFTPGDNGPVLLENHQQDVADRAELLASALNLPAGLARALRIAGEHHDDGKADLRFQTVRLGASSDGKPLAKSDPGKTIRQVREHEALGGLPARWRHEQRSVADSWAAVHAQSEADPELALRLIGTSHGRGRSGFPHVASELASTEDPADWRKLAAYLFDTGGWDALIEATHIRYGVWGCAYLEAVLRAADCQVSGEGR